MLHHGLLVLAALAVIVGAWAGARGVRLLARGLRRGEDPSAPLWVVRGLRGIIVALCMASLAIGTVLGQVWRSSSALSGSSRRSTKRGFSRSSCARERAKADARRPSDGSRLPPAFLGPD